MKFFLILCPITPVLAGDTVEFDSGVVSGGTYLNLWHNAPGFAYWGDSLAPNGAYQSYDWNGPNYVNKSYSLDGNTITVLGGTVTGCIFGAINDVDSDAVTNNLIILRDGTVQVGDRPGITYVEGTSGNIFGGWNRLGVANGNRVEIYGGTILQGVRGGVSSGNDANYNSVFISDGVIRSGIDDVMADLTWNDPDGNPVPLLLRDVWLQDMDVEVDPTNAIVMRTDVYGGSAGNGNALGNSVTMTGGSVGDRIYGGHSTYGSASENIVDISGTSEVGQSVYGGQNRANGGFEVRANQVTISGNAVIGSKPTGWGGNVYGGYNDTFGVTVINNEVTLSGNARVKSATTSWGPSGGSVYGGYVDTGGSSIIGNKVSVNDHVVVEANVAGGYTTGSGAVTGNSVAVSDSANVGGNVYGGHGNNSGDVTGNGVVIDGASVGGNVYGGNSNISGNVSNNSVAISGASVGGDIYGGRSNGSGTTETSNNSVTISGNSKVTGDVYGGNASGGWYGSTTASNNSVTISGINTEVDGDVYGGNSTGSFYSTDTGKATGNTIVMNGATVKKNIYGGRTYNDDATGNSITFNGGTVLENVYGGHIEWFGNATHNTITLNDNPTFGVNTILYGGYIDSLGAGNAFTGNTLNVNGYQGTVGSLANFENYNFLLPSVLWPELTMVHVTGAAVDLDNTNVALNGKLPGNGGRRLYAGDYIILIDKTTGTPVSRSVVPIHHGLLVYNFRLSVEGINNMLIAILDGVSAPPEGGSLPDGPLAGLNFLNRGADLAAWDGLRVACCKRGLFATLGGNWNRYKTGEHIDANGFSLMAGLSTCSNFACGKLLFAPFLETGAGTYNSFNIFDGNTIRANGKINYFGGGLLTRYSLPCGRYIDASVRIGAAGTDYASADLNNLTGVMANYDLNSTYVGSHFGVGREWNISQKTSLDMYGKYLFQHLDGGIVDVAGDPLQFHSMNSHRTRLGGRVNYAVNRQWSTYLGAAWEHEFSGAARASIDGYHIGTSSVRGDTGIGEVGLSWKSKKYCGTYVDLGIQCYTGKREGVTAAIHVGRNF